LAAERDELRIVADQVGAPTSANAIANAVLKVITRWQVEMTGTYHLVNAGQTSWHGFARAIVEEYAQLQAARGWPSLKVNLENIQAITTKEFPTPAVRPANSCLDCTKLARDFSVQLPHWHNSLVSEMQALNLG